MTRDELLPPSKSVSTETQPVDAGGEGRGWDAGPDVTRLRPHQLFFLVIVESASQMDLVSSSFER